MSGNDLIYISIIEQVDYSLLNDVFEHQYCRGGSLEFSSYCLKSIFQTDPDALANSTAQKVKRDLDDGGAATVRMFGNRGDTYMNFKGDGDKVARALCDIFDFSAKESSGVEVKVTELLNTDPIVRDLAKYEDPDAKVRHFVLAVKGGIEKYMKANSIQEWKP